MLSALLWRGIPGQVLDAVFDEKYRSVMSEAILAELSEVLSRDKFAINVRERGFMVAEIVNKIRLASEIINPTTIMDVPVRDPKDIMLLECAASGGVDYLVSGDKDLTSLVEYRETKIVTPAIFLEILGD